MNMLPRLKPRTFYDLVIEVAIVRPGPIQGDMVHPYLKRRGNEAGADRISLSRNTATANELQGYPAARPWACRCSRNRRCGSPSRRRNSRPRKPTGCAAPWRRSAMSAPSTNSKRRWSASMIARGYPAGIREKLLQPDQGLWRIRLSGKPCRELRAAGLCLVMAEAFHPDAFCCGLLNSQPMGFYAPAQIVGDARKNGVEVREIDVSFSHARQHAGGERAADYHAVRLGFRQIDGFRGAIRTRRVQRIRQFRHSGAREARPANIENSGLRR